LPCRTRFVDSKLIEAAIKSRNIYWHIKGPFTPAVLSVTHPGHLRISAAAIIYGDFVAGLEKINADSTNRDFILQRPRTFASTDVTIPNANHLWRERATHGHRDELAVQATLQHLSREHMLHQSAKVLRGKSYRSHEGIAHLAACSVICKAEGAVDAPRMAAFPFYSQQATLWTNSKDG